MIGCPQRATSCTRQIQKQSTKAEESRIVERLGEDICHVVIGRDVLDRNRRFFDLNDQGADTLKGLGEIVDDVPVVFKLADKHNTLTTAKLLADGQSQPPDDRTR